MIVNIPLQTDEEYIEKSLAKDYAAKVLEAVRKDIDATLLKYAPAKYGSWRSSSDPGDGMAALIRQTIDEYIQDWKPLIIDAAADKLAERLCRTKAAKEMLLDIVEDVAKEEQP